MTIDVSALEAELDAPPPVGRRCALQTLVAEHPEAEGVLRRAVADQTRSAARAAEILNRNGLKISETSIKRHRQGACQQCREDAK